MNKKNFWISCLIVSVLFVGMGAFAAPVPETGVKKCYDNSGEIACPEPGEPFYGQDASYTINPMSFTKLDANGSNKTTLVQLQKENDLSEFTSQSIQSDNQMNQQSSTGFSIAASITVPYTTTGLAWENGNLWAVSDDAAKIFRVDSTGEIVSSFYAPGSDPMGLVFDGIHLFNVDFIDHKIYEISLLGTEFGSIPAPSGIASGLAWDGKYFWVSEWYSKKIYQIDPTDGTILNSLRAPGANPYGLTWDGKHLWTSNSNGIYCLDPSTGDVLSSWEDSAVKYGQAYGLTWDGKYLWGGSWITEKIIKINVPSLESALSILPSNQSVSGNNGTTSFDVSNAGSGTMGWTATVTSGGGWLTITSGTSGINAGTITCAFTANTTASSRIATIRVTAPGAAGSPKDVTVTQAAAPAQTILSVTPASQSVPKESGNTNFSVSNTGYGTMSWTAAVTSGGGWLTITSGTSGTNAGTITCAYTANTSTATRTATIRITAPGATGSPQDVTVVQAGAVTQRKSQFLGAWADGVYAWNQSTKQWTKIPNTAGVSMIATGKVDNDAVEDLIGVWPGGLYVRQSTTGVWVKLSDSPPTWITAGDLNKDGRDEVIASWKGLGVHYLDFGTGKWNHITSPALQLAAGNMQREGQDDLIGVWDSGLWVRYSATGSWQKISAVIPIWIAAGNMSGTGLADIVSSYATGTWFRNSQTSAWTSVCIPAEQLTAGDLDGDGRDDLIGVWSNGVWVRYGTSGEWQSITVSKPKWITTGRL